MAGDSIVFSMFLIFSGAAVLATLALYTRQSLLVVYMLLGMLVGPWGLHWINDPSLTREIGDVGIIFLLFLLGLHLQPQNLIHTLSKTVLVTVASSVFFAAVGYIIARVFGLTLQDSLIIGAAMMFSSTIIGLKLLPTTVLHHQYVGELMVSILLLQDLLAIFVLLILDGAVEGFSVGDVVIIVFALPGLLAFAYLFERYVLFKLLKRFDQIHEYLFLLTIGWCLGMAELARVFGLSAEIGAFIAGVSLAASPVALYIAQHLKPLRDFFLIIFFFAVGAQFNLTAIPEIITPAIILAVALLVLKPFIIRSLLVKVKDTKPVAWEVGIRLGQASEFSILTAYLASASKLISDKASFLIQAATLITFVVSSYWVVLRYPTPMAISERLRRD